jgi:hypothetical protein
MDSRDHDGNGAAEQSGGERRQAMPDDDQHDDAHTDDRRHGAHPVHLGREHAGSSPDVIRSMSDQPDRVERR